MRVVWRVLRWVLIAVGTFSVASAATSVITLALLHHGRHLHAWMVWVILAVSFGLVWTAVGLVVARPQPQQDPKRSH